MAWKTVRLGDVLEQRRNKIPLEPGTSYKQVTVRLWGKGLTLRNTVDGSEIAADSQVVVSANDFVISRSDARHGAFGVVPQSLDGAVVSTDFPCFTVDQERLSVGFLNWFSKTKTFVSLCKLASKGSTNRVRLKEHDFLALEIPLPSPDEQNAILNRLDEVQAKLEERADELETIEREADAMLFNAFQEIICGVKYLPLSEVAPLVRREIEIDPNTEYTEIGVRSFYKGVFHRRTMAGSEFSWQKLFRVHEGDLVFSNLMAWEEAIAVAGVSDAMCVGNHRMLTCAIKPDLAEPSFLFHYFQTPEGFGKILDSSPGSIARNKTLSSKKLPLITVPVPEIALQRRFARLRANVEQMRAIRASTAKDTEALIPAMLHEIFEGQASKPEAALTTSEANVVHLPAKQKAEIDTPFKEAVLVGAIVKAFHEDNGQPIGNFRLQKAVYFARRQMGESALDKEYLRKAAGPYNPRMRYSGGIKIATDKSWIKRATGKYGEGNTLGDATADMYKWIERYQYAPAAAWVRDRFKYKSNDLWEALATIDYTMLALQQDGIRPTPAAILAYVEGDKEWRPKIRKLRLSEASIQNVMVELESLLSSPG